MTQISACVPEDLARGLDDAAANLGTSRAEVVRMALQQFLMDLEDVALAQAVAEDPNDPVLDWKDIRGELFGTD